MLISLYLVELVDLLVGFGFSLRDLLIELIVMCPKEGYLLEEHLVLLCQEVVPVLHLHHFIGAVSAYLLGILSLSIGDLFELPLGNLKLIGECLVLLDDLLEVLILLLEAELCSFELLLKLGDLHLILFE